jgi:hypothetical protein
MWWSGCLTPPFLILALDGGECSDSLHGHINPVEVALIIHWVSPRTNMGTMEREQIFSLPETEPRPSSP